MNWFRNSREFQVLGVTVATPDCMEMAVEAAHRFTGFTGIRTSIMSVNETEDVFLRTLELGVNCPDYATIFFFDADWWLLKRFDWKPFVMQAPIFGCVDPGVDIRSEFPYRDCISFKIDPDKYLNTGFLVFNSRHRKVFKQAINILTSKSFREKSHDFGEQSAFNYAIKKTTTDVRVLHHGMNFFPMFCAHQRTERHPVIDDPVAIHAAGYGRMCDPETKEFLGFKPEQKLEALRYYAFKYNDIPKI